MSSYNKSKLRAQLAILRDVVSDGYAGHTIENIIQQLEQRVKELEKQERP